MTLFGCFFIFLANSETIHPPVHTTSNSSNLLNKTVATPTQPPVGNETAAHTIGQKQPAQNTLKIVDQVKALKPSTIAAENKPSSTVAVVGGKQKPPSTVGSGQKPSTTGSAGVEKQPSKVAAKIKLPQSGVSQPIVPQPVVPQLVVPQPAAPQPEVNVRPIEPTNVPIVTAQKYKPSSIATFNPYLPTTENVPEPSTPNTGNKPVTYNPYLPQTINSQQPKTGKKPFEGYPASVAYPEGTVNTYPQGNRYTYPFSKTAQQNTQHQSYPKPSAAPTFNPYLPMETTTPALSRLLINKSTTPSPKVLANKAQPPAARGEGKIFLFKHLTVTKKPLSLF